jgi:hypothetical protein
MKQHDLFSKEPAEPDRILKMLALLGSMGAGKDLVSALADFGGVQPPNKPREKCVFDSKLDAMRYLRGPLIIHRNGWTDTLPDWMPAQAMMERSEIVLGDSPYLVGPTEIAAVMYPATMEHPLRSDTCELYLWATANASARHFGKKVKEYWKMLDQRPIADKEVIERGGRLWNNYADLVWEIRRKVIHAQAEREKADKRATVPAQVLKAKLVKRDTQPVILREQLSLFAA